jgi:hypothetical protein
MERFAVIAQPSAESVDDTLDPLRWNPAVFGDAGHGRSGSVPVAIAVSDAVPVGRSGSRDVVSVVVRLLADAVRTNPLCELNPADATHLIGKYAGEQDEITRVFKIRQGRKHPQV